MGLGRWLAGGRNPDAPQQAGLTPQQIQAIYEQQAALARSSMPTEQAWANALRTNIAQQGQDLTESLNSRGQVGASGVYADALARATGRETTTSELERQRMLSGQIGNFYNTGYSGAIQANMANAENANQRYIADRTQRAMNRNRRRGMIGAGAGALIGAAAGGGIAGAQLGAQLGGAVGSGV